MENNWGQETETDRSIKKTYLLPCSPVATADAIHRRYDRFFTPYYRNLNLVLLECQPNSKRILIFECRILL